MNELWHVSEDPKIEVFHPHQNELHALDEPLVWAVDSHYQWLYWFPRDCPRACFEANDETTDEDVERWLDGDRTRRVAVIETGWLERVRRARLYLYRFTSADERRRTGAWWTRSLAGPYFPEVRLRQ